MEHQDYIDELRLITYISSVNMRYHAILEWRYGLSKRLLSNLSALLAVAGLCVITMFPWLSETGFCLMILSASLVALFNICAMADKEKHHRRMFSDWSYLRMDAHADALSSVDLLEPLSQYRFDRFRELSLRMENLHLRDNPPWVKLLERCQEDENESEWGKGIRSYDQVEAERKRRESL